MPKFYVGIDIGGTKIQGVVWDGKRSVKELTVVTPGNAESFKRSVLKLVDFLSAGFKISGVGLGMAGFIDSKKGVALASPNIRYVKNLPLVQLVREHGYNNVALDNDASCFLRAETEVGKAKKFRDVFGLIAGTGVGGAMKLGGRLYRGADNAGGEIGQWLIGGERLEKSYQAAKQRKDFKKLSEIFGAALANAINLLSPECIVVGGTFGQLYHSRFLEPALRLARKHAPVSRKMPKLMTSTIKAAGAIGAALLVAD